ncbi:MAG: hypothetical protein DI589_06610 [Shinella sp.]|nr:MAG: hypothetical protein DI589_06610 [Shinella sp.]
MTGPFIPSRVAQPLDILEQGVTGNGWEGLEEIFRPHIKEAPLQPSDAVAKSIWMLWQYGGESRQVLEWLMDITLRMPYRATGRTIEETALMAANRQGINGVGEAVLAALAHGRSLMEKSETQNGAGS